MPAIVVRCMRKAEASKLMSSSVFLIFGYEGGDMKNQLRWKLAHSGSHLDSHLDSRSNVQEDYLLATLHLLAGW